VLLWINILVFWCCGLRGGGLFAVFVGLVLSPLLFFPFFPSILACSLLSLHPSAFVIHHAWIAPSGAHFSLNQAPPSQGASSASFEASFCAHLSNPGSLLLPKQLHQVCAHGLMACIGI